MTGTNFELVQLFAKVTDSYGFLVTSGGSGVTHPFTFTMGSTEAWRVTTDPYFQLDVNVIANADDTLSMGTATTRWGNINLGGDINFYLASADTYPALQLTGGGSNADAILFGPGGSTAPTVAFQYANATGALYLTTTTAAAGNLARLSIFGTVALGTGQNSVFELFGIPGTNGEWLEVDAYRATQYSIRALQTGGGSLRPIVFLEGATEAFRISTDPYIQSSVNVNPFTDSGAGLGTSTKGWSALFVHAFYLFGSSTGYTSLTSGLTSSSNNSLALPITASDTLAAIATAQTWSALQKFTNGDFAILGSSSGYTLLESGLGSTSNNTLTLPTSATDTLAALGTAQTWTALQQFANGDLGLVSGSYYILLEAAGSAGVDYTVTFPLNTGTVAELNLAEAWTAVQTFGNNISIGGAIYDIGKSTSIATGDIIYYDGTNWINLAVGGAGTFLGVSSGAPHWATPTVSTGFANFRLTSPTTTVNGTTSTGLTLSLAANTNYTFKAYIYFLATSNNSSPDFEIHALAAGASLVWVSGAGHSSATGGFVGGNITAVTTKIFTGGYAVLGGNNYYVWLSGLITVGSNPTTLQIDVTDTVTTHSIATGSWIETQTIT